MASVQRSGGVLLCFLELRLVLEKIRPWLGSEIPDCWLYWNFRPKT